MSAVYLSAYYDVPPYQMSAVYLSAYYDVPPYQVSTVYLSASYDVRGLILRILSEQRRTSPISPDELDVQSGIPRQARNRSTVSSQGL